MRYANDTELTAFTITTAEFDDPVEQDFMRWVRWVPRDTDALTNLPLCLRSYDRQKTLVERIKCLFL